MLMKAVEARKKAEVAHMHANRCRNTHRCTRSTPQKEPKSLFPRWIPPSSPLCAPLFLHSFFSCTLTKSKDFGPQALFL